MLMRACEKCGGFPEFPFGHVLSCCYLATVRGLNIVTAETTPDMIAGLWKRTAKYRAAKRAEYAAEKRAFAGRERREG